MKLMPVPDEHGGLPFPRTSQNNGVTSAAVKASGTSFQSLGRRAGILLCFYAVVLASVPFWLRTTTIERLALPRNDVHGWESRLPCPVRLRHTLTLRLPPDVVARKDERDVARQLALGLKAAGDGVWQSNLEDHIATHDSDGREAVPPQEHAACIDWNVRLSESFPLLPSSLHYIVSISEGDASDFFLSTSTTRRFGLNLEEKLDGRAPADVAWLLTWRLSDILQLPYRDLFFHTATPTIEANGTYAKVGLTERDVLRSVERTEADKRQVPYTHNIRLVFSLINEDLASQKIASELVNDPQSLSGIAEWDGSHAQKAFARRITPVVEAVQGIHHVVSEMQTIWFAPLSFETKEVRTSSNAVQHLIRPEDLQIFVDAGEWGLTTGGSSASGSSSKVDPTTEQDSLQSRLRSLTAQKERTLHFVLYVPKPSHRPMRIAQDESATSASNATAWLVPQWGGVALYNLGHESAEEEGGDGPDGRQNNLRTSLNAKELDKPFASFGKQLATLLGIRPTPSGAHAAQFPSSEAKMAVALDALARRRVVESLRETVRTMASIVRLVDKIKNLGVGKEVQNDVETSMAMLQTVVRASENGDSSMAQGSPSSGLPYALSPLIRLMELAFGAEMLSAAAFFNPQMLEQLYFPDEHKYAVYTPLFGPLALPFLVAGIRLVRDRRRRTV